MRALISRHFGRAQFYRGLHQGSLPLALAGATDNRSERRLSRAGTLEKKKLLWTNSLSGLPRRDRVHKTPYLKMIQNS